LLNTSSQVETPIPMPLRAFKFYLGAGVNTAIGNGLNGVL